MEIKGSHVLITGSNRGIGRAVALMCAENKAHLHLANRTQEKELLQECQRLGAASVKLYDLDLASKENINEFLSEIAKQEIDILFNNAGQLTGGLLEEQPLEDIFSMLQVNINAIIHLTHGVLPGMLKRKRGKIINNASISGIMTMPCASTYSASKSAVIAFTECLDLELNGTGVSTLLLITPGIETRMLKDIPKKYGKNYKDLSFIEKGLSPKKYAKIIREAIIEDLKVLKPQGLSGVGLLLAEHAPKIFHKLVATKFRR